MRLLKLHPAETRGDLDPLPFPVNAVRQLINNRATRARDADSLESIENVERAFARVDETMAQAARQNDALFSPFLTRSDDGPRAA